MPELTDAQMHIGMGVLAGLFVVFVIAPFLWSRAVKVTNQKLHGKTNLTFSELNVDKEKLRSEISMTARELDIAVEEWQDRAAMRLIEIGHATDACNSVLADVDTREETLGELETEIAHIRRDISDIRESVDGHIYTMTKQSAGLADQRTKYEEITKLLNEVSGIADERKIEIVSMRTQISNLNDRIEELRKEQLGLSGERHTLKGELGDSKAGLAAANTQVQKLEFAVKQREGTIEKYKAQMEKRKAEHDKRAEETAAMIEQLRKEKTEIRKSMTESVQNLEAELARERAASKQLREEMTNVAAKVANLSPEKDGPSLFDRVVYERNGNGARANGNGSSRQRLRSLSNIDKLADEAREVDETTEAPKS